MSDKPLDLASLFLAALEIEDAGDRQAFLDDHCGNSKQCDEVQKLLGSYEQAQGFLSTPPSAYDATVLDEVAPAGGTSVLKLMSRAATVPRVVLNDSIDDSAEPIIRPTSPEMPQHAADSRYQLQGEIARGGMGAILKGRDVDLGRNLAVKVLLDSHKNKPEVVQRFIEEAQIGGQLQHPGIAPVYELGQFADQRPFFTMKLVKGKTLASLLAERSGPEADRGRLLGIFEQVCQTVAYAHSRGVIHRDLKPANVMVGSFGEVQVMDWGLAKVLSAGGVADEKKAKDTHQDRSVIQTLRSSGSDIPGLPEGSGGSAGSETQMGSVMGTPAYMPPEQALGEIDRLDERSDVFGLGAILSEILTGKPPYVNESATEVFRMATRGKLDDCFARLDDGDADAELVQLTKQCLTIEPVDRPRNADEVAGRISGYLESVETRLRETEVERAAEAARVVEERKRRKVMMALAASALLTVIVAAGGWIWIQEKETAIAQAAADAKSQLEQQIAGELSSARALANFDEDKLPDQQAVTRALATVARAEKLLKEGDANRAFEQTALAMRTDLERLQGDQTLITALEAAWETEMRQIAADRQAALPSGLTPATASTAPESERSTGSEPLSKPSIVIDAATEYEAAFADWGLLPGKMSQADAAKRIEAMHRSLQPTVLVSLSRWHKLLSGIPNIDQWEQRSWKGLEVVELTSRGGDMLKVQKDGSVLASGPSGSAGYDLVFETDETTLAALRLETLLHDSLPDKGPGRGPWGVFHLRGLSVAVAPRSQPDQLVPVVFQAAVADYSSELYPVSIDHWEIGSGSGSPHTAVYVCAKPLKSESGFRIAISNEDHPHRSDSWDDASLGRFRWSVNSKAPRDEDIGWLAGLSEVVDRDKWRTSLREEVARDDYAALFRRANDQTADVSQPKMVLIELANQLRNVSGHRLIAPASNSVTWDVVSPEDMTLQLEPGVKFDARDDQSVALSGHDPEQESIRVTFPVDGTPITAIRIELLRVPDLQDQIPSIGRTEFWTKLAELDVSLPGDDDEAWQPIECRHLLSDYDRPFSLANTRDRDPLTYVTIPEPDKKRTILFVTNSAELKETASLRIRLQTVDTKCIARFRISLTRDEIEIPNPQLAATNLLQRLNEQDPGDYWVQLALAEAMQNEMPPRLDDALRHATAAVALRPNAMTSHEAVLRSLPVNQLEIGSRFGRLARTHAQRLRATGHPSKAVQHLVKACIADADRLAAEKDDEAALRKYRFVLQLDPATPETARDVGYRLRTQQRFSEAMAAYDAGLVSNPDSAMLLNGRGLVYEGTDQLDKAIEQLRKALAADPSFIMAYRNLSRVLANAGKSSEAIEILKEAATIDAQNPDSFNEIGFRYSGLGNKKQAALWLSKAIEVDPGYSRGYRNLAVYLRRAEQWSEAIEMLNRGIRAAPHDSENFEHLGWIYRQQKKWDEAAAAYRKAVDLAPTNSTYLSSLATSLLELDKVDEAIQVWKDCIPLAPHQTYPLNNLAVLLINVDRLDEAADACKRVIELDPKSGATSYANLGYILRLAGRPDEAEAVYRKSTEQLPDDGNGYLHYARLLESQEKLDDAARMYRRAIDCDPSLQRAYYWLHLVRKKQGRLADAIAAQREQIENLPAVAFPYLAYATLLRDAGRFEEAIPVFQHAAASQLDNHRVMHQIAWALAEDTKTATPKNAKWAVELASTAKGTDSAFGLLALGAGHYRTGDWPAALEALQEALDCQGWSKWSVTTRVSRANARCFQAMAAFQTGDAKQASESLRHAERELGSRAFADVSFEWNSKLPLADRSAFRLLKEARGLLGEPTEFTDQRQRDRLKQMMIVAREVARTAPVEADGPGNEVSTWDTWSDFAIAYYRTVNWKGAAAEARLAIEFEAANRMNPNELGSEHTLLVMAPLMLLEGEQAAFQQLCQLHPAALRMANQDPDAAGQSRRILREHQKVRAVDRGQGWSVWSRGLANLRSGNYQKAEKLFHRSAVHYPGIGNQLKKNLAIAITHRLNGDKSQAEQRLAKARELYEDYQAGGDYFHDRIEIAVLRAEAGRIISDEEKEDSIREEARTWTEASGKTTEAKFLNVANGFVVLETAAETILQIALERLSESDREFCVARQGS